MTRVRRLTRLVGGAMAACLLMCGAAAQQPPGDRFIVGIVRSVGGDIALEPIARFTGTAWVNTWPGPMDESTPLPTLDAIPDAWLGGPVPRTWTMWSGDGRSRAIRVAGTRHGPACEALIELTLDNPTKVDPKPEQARVALDVTRHVDGFRAITERDPEWAAIERVIGALVTDAAFAQMPLTIEYLVRPTSQTAPPVYRFEATKRRDANDKAVIVMGWLRADATGAWKAFGVEQEPREIDGNAIPSRVPLATFRLGGRDYALIGLRKYEGLAASIVEITATDVVEILNVPRMGC